MSQLLMPSPGREACKSRNILKNARQSTGVIITGCLEASAVFVGFGYFIDRDHISSDPHGHVVLS